MENLNRDLWPEDIVSTSNLVTPLSLLKEQASLLGQKTKNLVQAEVKTEPEDFGRFLRHSFYLVAPAINHYRYQLFQVEHPVTSFYPASFIYGSSTKKETESEEKFIEFLKVMLSDERTKKVIQSLIAQSQS